MRLKMVVVVATFSVTRLATAQTSDSAVKRGSVDATVVTEFVMLEDGTADMVTFSIVRSSDEHYNQAAKDQVSQMRFTPKEVNGRRVKQLVQLPVEFRSRLPGTEPIQPASPSAFGSSTQFRIRSENPDSVRAAFADSLRMALAALPASSSQHVYAASEVDKQVRNPDGKPVPSTLPPEVVAFFGADVLLEFVVNADGSIEASTIKILRAPSAEVGAAVARGTHMQLLPAELGKKRVRQLVQFDTPVRMEPRR